MFAFMGFYQNFNFGMFTQTFNTFPVFNFSSFNTNFNMNFNTNFNAIFNYNYNFNTNFSTNFYNQNFTTNFNYFSPQSLNNTITFNNFNSAFGSVTKGAKKAKKKEKDISYDAEALKQSWKNKKPNLTDEFYNRIVEISKRIKCDPNDLMGVMNSESGINHKAVNKTSKATGLIQFMPSTAKALGTTVEELAEMSAMEQLDYVEKYLLERIKACEVEGTLDAATLYSLVFWPEAANKGENYLIATQGTRVYNQNKGLDTNGDSKITKADLGRRVMDFRA